MPGNIHQNIGAGRGRWTGMGGVAITTGLRTMTHKKRGESLGTSLLKGIGTGAFYAFAPKTLTAAAFTAPMVKGAIQGSFRASRNITDRRRQQTRPGTSFTYRDSNAALTMRQASVQAIQGSKLNARNALGGEASLMHRSYARK